MKTLQFKTNINCGGGIGAVNAHAESSSRGRQLAGRHHQSRQNYDHQRRLIHAETDYRHLNKEGNRLHPWADLAVPAQATYLEANLFNNKSTLKFEGWASYKGDYETETHLLRYLDKRQFWAAFAGYDLRDNKNLRGSSLVSGRNRANNLNFRRQAEVGVYCLLPLLFRAELRTSLTGQPRLQPERRDLPLSSNVFMEIRGNTDQEFTVGFRYMVRKYASRSTNYDNQYGWGAGLALHY